MSTFSNTPNEIIDRYAKGPTLLQRVVRGLEDEDLDYSEGVHCWTIREYIHHIVDGDDLWKTFIKRAIGNPHGIFQLEWYWQVPEQEYWSQAWRYANREIAPSLALFRANRAHITQLLRLMPSTLENQLMILWPNGQEEMVSVFDVVEMQTRHVEGHIADMKRAQAGRRIQEQFAFQ